MLESYFIAPISGKGLDELVGLPVSFFFNTGPTTTGILAEEIWGSDSSRTLALSNSALRSSFLYPTFASPQGYR